MRDVFLRLLVAAWCAGTSAAAAETVEEVVVTGTRVPGASLQSAAPLTVLSGDDLARSGYASVGDAIRLLPSNAGSEFNLDVFTQNLSVGTSNYNLRGLGLNATLVLVNGRRQTVSGGVADDGTTFVDLNALMPAIMLARVEVLKDGAAALYGTDAVAGVANHITRAEFRGVEVQLDDAITARDGQNDFTASAIAGAGGARWHAVGAVSFLDRGALPATSRAYTAGKAFSSFGQPGAFILTAPSPAFPDLPVGSSLIDPACGGAAGGSPNPRAVQPPGVRSALLGTCTFDFSSYYDLVPREQRWNGYGTADLSVSDTLTAFGEVGFARNRVVRGTSPSFPLLNLVTVPADNPGNVFRAPAQFLGRALGASAARDTVRHASDTWRVVAGLRGELARQWAWEVAGTYSDNAFFVGINDVLADRFIAALNGRGGPSNNQYFNPFGSAATAQPGDPTYNDPAVVRDFISTNTYDYTARLATVDVTLTGDIGAAGFAAGGQLRRDTFTGAHNDAFNAERYLFAIGGPDFHGARTTWAAFAEVRLPLAPWLDAQFALRHEDGEARGSTDPKIALAWRPVQGLTARGSFATSFRAPSVFQTAAVQTVLENIFDPLTGTTSFRGVRTRGSTNLAPEDATVANIGLTLAPSDDITFDLDGWRYDYRDLIVKQSAQAILSANPLDSRVQRQAGQILRVETAYINAPRALTDGLDFSARAAWADFTLAADATYIRRFIIQESPTAPRRDVAGSRNFTSFARSLPRWRSNMTAGWSDGRQGVTATVRVIGAYRDDQNGNRRIPPEATLDLQYRFKTRSADHSPELAIGVLNLMDRDPPSVQTNAGYDSKVHDPRGRVFYARLRAGW